MITMDDTTFVKSDHDLLVVLNTQVSNIRAEIKELKEGTIRRILDLEQNKADKNAVGDLQIKVNTDLETRVRTLESAHDIERGTGNGVRLSWGVVTVVLSLVIAALAIIVGTKYL